MIDIKQIAKAKSGSTGGSSSTTSGSTYVGKTVTEAKHATKADLASRASKADYADQAEYADRAGYASRATYADTAGDIAEGSPVYDKFLRKDVDDTAKGKITLEDGLNLGAEGLYGMDKDGNGTLNLVKMLAAYGLGDVLSDSFSQTEKTGFWLTDDDNSGHSYLEVDKLYVRMKAIFDELEIRKRSYVGGNQIFSCAASRLTDVVWWTAETNDAGEKTTDITKIAAFKCYIKTDDGTTETENWWQVDDLAICQTFNINEQSEVRGAKNKYYWRKVTDVGKETITHSDGSVEVMGYILLSNTTEGVGYASTGVDHTADATTYGTTKVVLAGSQAVVTDGDILTTGTDSTQMPSDFPETDDTVVQLGCADSTKGRGNALEIIVYSPSASGSAVLEGMTCSAPAIIQYNDITTFSLANKAKVVISPSGNVFKAKSFVIETGEQSVRIPIDLGEWQEGTEYAYYSRVSHEGQLWLLDKIAEDATTTEEPKEGCVYWTCQVEKGKQGDSIQGEPGVSSLDIKFYPETLIFDTDDDGVLTGTRSGVLMVSRGGTAYTYDDDYKCVVTAVGNLTLSDMQSVLYTTGPLPTIKIRATDITTYDTGLTDANGNKIVFPYTEGYVDIKVTTTNKPIETQVKRLSWKVNYAKYIGRQSVTQKEFKSEYESYTNANDTNISKMQSAITQNAESVEVVAQKFNADGTLANTSGLLTTADASGLFAIDGDGNLKSIVESSQEGVKIKADNIKLEGLVTANDNFKVLEDGSIEATGAKISGEVNATSGTFSGEVSGITGSFKSLKCVDTSGEKVGGVSFDSNGNMTFTGDLYHQGTHSSGRHLRFYTQDIWCRCYFGHRGKVMAVVSGNTMGVYFGGTSAVSFSLASGTTGGVTYYKIPLYGQMNSWAGMPIDVVVFNCSTDYYYVFVDMYNGKEWRVINGNVTTNNKVHFADIGGWHELTGGSSLDCVYVNPDLNILTPTPTSVGKGVFWSGEKQLTWE